MLNIEDKIQDIIERYYPCPHHAAQNCSCEINLIQATNEIIEAMEGDKDD